MNRKGNGIQIGWCQQRLIFPVILLLLPESELFYDDELKDYIVFAYVPRDVPTPPITEHHIHTKCVLNVQQAAVVDNDNENIALVVAATHKLPNKFLNKFSILNCL